MVHLERGMDCRRCLRKFHVVYETSERDKIYQSYLKNTIRGQLRQSLERGIQGNHMCSYMWEGGRSQAR